MANNSTPDVFLLLGLEGGSNIGKGSGLLISTQLKQIMDQVEETITSHLKIKLDQNALSELKAQINGTVTEALTSIKETPVELTFTFNQGSIDKAFRDVKKQLKEQNITISAQPQEKKQRQGSTSLGNAKKEAATAKQSTNQIGKTAEAAKQEVKEIEKAAESTAQVVKKTVEETLTGIDAVLNKARNKIKSSDEDATLKQIYIEQIDEFQNAKKRALSTEEIAIFDKALDMTFDNEAVERVIRYFNRIKDEVQDTEKTIEGLTAVLSRSFEEHLTKYNIDYTNRPELLTSAGISDSYIDFDLVNQFLKTRRSKSSKSNGYIIDQSALGQFWVKNWSKYGIANFEDLFEKATEGLTEESDIIAAKNKVITDQVEQLIYRITSWNTGLKYIEDTNQLIISDFEQVSTQAESVERQISDAVSETKAFDEAVQKAVEHFSLIPDELGTATITAQQMHELQQTLPDTYNALYQSAFNLKTRGFNGETALNSAISPDNISRNLTEAASQAKPVFDIVEKEIEDIVEAEKNVVTTTSEVKYALSTLKQSDLPSLSSVESYNAFTSEPYATRMYELIQQRIQQALSAKMQSLTEVIPALPQNSLATIKEQARQKIVEIIKDVPTGIMAAINSEDAMGNLRSQMADTVNTITKNWLELPEMSSATLEERARAYDEIYSIVKHVFVSSFKMLDLAKSSSLGLSSGDVQLSTSDKMRSLSNAPLMITAESTATREAKQNIEGVTEALQENTEATNENAEAQEELSKAQQRILANAEKTRGRAAAFINQYSNLGQDRYEIKGNVNFEEFEERVSKIRELYSAIRNGEEGFDIAKTMPYGIETYIGALEELIAELNKGEGELKEFKNEASNITDDAARMKLEEYTRALRELNNAPGGQQYANTLGANIIPSDLQSEAETLQYVKDHYKDIAEATRNAARETERLNKQYDEEQNNVTQRNKIYQEADNYYKKYQSGIKANITLNQRWLELLEKINTGGFADNQSARRALAELQTATKEANAETMTLWGSLKKLFTDHFGSVSATAAIGTLRNILREAYQNVLDIDKAMTELRKVTNETERTYEAFGQTAANVAQRVGSSVADAINSTADFARLGFDLDQSTALAEAAMVYKNVGDGIEDINEASESIISTIKAFNDIDANDAMSIIDKFNEVGNNYAISSEGIGIALQKSAAALASANNTLDESIALITAGNTVVQNPEVIGTTMKTISMFLRASKTEAEEAGIETEGMAESVSKLREEIKSLSGVDIMLDEENYKSTYQILKEISEVWGEISDVSQANILEKLGGKRNANVVASVIENFDVAEQSLLTSMNSLGSATQENEKFLDSIAGHINKLTVAYENLSTTVIDSDLVKFGVDFLTGITQGANDFISTVKPLPALITAVTAGLSAFKDVGRDKMPSLTMEYADFNVVVTRNELIAA